jgi:hypothetical protein
MEKVTVRFKNGSSKQNPETKSQGVFREMRRERGICLHRRVCTCRCLSNSYKKTGAARRLDSLDSTRLCVFVRVLWRCCAIQRLISGHGYLFLWLGLQAQRRRDAVSREHTAAGMCAPPLPEDVSRAYLSFYWCTTVLLFNSPLLHHMQGGPRGKKKLLQVFCRSIQLNPPCTTITSY